MYPGAVFSSGTVLQKSREGFYKRKKIAFYASLKGCFIYDRKISSQ